MIHGLKLLKLLNSQLGDYFFKRLRVLTHELCAVINILALVIWKRNANNLLLFVLKVNYREEILL